MLKSLTVENYALIEKLEMQLDKGLNIITGETGAGKSILLGALALLLGAKNDGTATRDNEQNCVVEGLFDISKLNLQSFFEEQDWDYEEEVAIRRVILPSGKSRSFVGDVPASLAQLKELSTRLIDIHSQHKNLIITDEQFRITALDMLSESAEILSRYEVLYEQLQRLRGEQRRLRELSESSQRECDWLRHQVAEIAEANLTVGEQEEVQAELKVLENADQIVMALANFYNMMDGNGDDLVLERISTLRHEMLAISKFYAPAVSYVERIDGVREELNDMCREISYKIDDIDSDPRRKEYLNNRLNTIYTLTSKHNVADIEELLTLYTGYAQKLEHIESCDEELGTVTRELEKCQTKIELIAHELHVARCKAAPLFSQTITEMLHRLGIPQGRFELSVERLSHLTPRGGDKVEFLYSSVENKSLQPVDKIASGGEISRVMLSLKSLLSRRMELPTIIFDEIDSGVSGRIADSMGAIIYELSSTMQVIDITHLPQVAAKGDSHFVVYREASHTNIKRLDATQRLDHIAMMLSGSEVTDAARTQAKMLLAR